MNIKPIGSRILLEIDDSPEMTRGGLIVVELPDSDGDHRVRPTRGAVLAVGPGVEDVEVGQTVIVDTHYGVRLPGELRGKMLVKEAFVALIVEEADE